METLLWLDADRLEDLGRMMNQEKLDKQREVVLNERRQSYENQPYGNANALARSAIPYENGLLVLVGDRKLIFEQTAGLGLKIENP